ncbi:MAG: hypothetical protein JWM47_13 [Acidimicrobiales bacterium]|nr:hypothetical protein [Acidimicrobiales bacterium]
MSDDLLDALLGLNRVLAEREPLDDTLGRVAQVGRRAVEGCGAAGITVYRGERLLTAGFSGDDAPVLDDAQYRADAGPCLHAYRTNATVDVPDLQAEDRWPEFRAVAADLGYRSSWSSPLVASGLVLGSLNLYGADRAAFGDGSRAVARLFAEEVAVTLTNAMDFERYHELAGQLGTALETRDLIGQAKGILMHQRRLSAHEAFEALVVASQARNVKLRTVAEEVARTGELHDH